MYTFQSKVRYSESDSEGKLSLPSLLNYFQDCSTFQSEELGVGISYLKENHLVWVLSSWQIVVDRYPKLCEEVEIGTFPYDFKGFMGSRNFFMKAADGSYIAKANSLWTLLNTDTMRPAATPPQMLQKYTLESKLDMDYASRKITVPAGGSKMESLVVRKHHLDTNYHVNNGQYISIAMEYLPEEFAGEKEICQLRAEYKMQAFLNDELYPYVARQGNIVTISLRNECDKPFVNVEFTKRG